MDIGPWDVLAILIKAVTYGATLGAAGGAFFLGYSHELIDAANFRRIRRLVWMLALMGVLASCLKILVTAGSMSGELAGMLDPAFNKMILQTNEGRALAVRLVALSVMLAGLLVAPHRRPHVALAGALAAATSFAWVGHAHAATAATPATWTLAVHLAGAAFWLGALPPLLLIARSAEISQVALVAARFGAAALIVVGVLLAAGICLLCFLLQRVSELWTGSYGRLIVAKLALVACLLAVAALNRLRLTPRLQSRDPRALRALKKSLSVEILIASIILILTAAMTTLTGPGITPE
jgi:putative copper resistance protein D